jgi:hypothetical protein
VANFKALHFAEGIVVSRSQFDVYPSSFVPVLASHNAMHALAKLSFSAGNDFTNGTNRKPADLKEMDCCFDSTESQTAKKRICGGVHKCRYLIHHPFLIGFSMKSTIQI